jgi:hypothetical protein
LRKSSDTFPDKINNPRMFGKAIPRIIRSEKSRILVAVIIEPRKQKIKNKIL